MPSIRFDYFFFFQVGSGEVFSITEDLTKSPECEEDEWQDVEVSEEWGPQTPMTQTPMTPLNDDEDPDAYLPTRSVGVGGGDTTKQTDRFPVMRFRRLHIV